MRMIRFVGWPGGAATFVVVAAALAACGNSNIGGNETVYGDDGGSDATTPPGNGADAGHGSDANVPTDANSGGEAGGGDDAGDDGGTEPAYLRNDTVAGFAFTANYGSPYDSILGAPLDTTQSAIAAGAQPVSAPNQIVANERFTLVANSADVYNALDISASLSVSTGLASVNAKTSFAQSTQVDTTNLTVLVDLTQVGPAQKITNPSLTPEAAALTPEQFYALYGDRYAAEIVTGAEMFCTLTIYTYSQEDKTALTTSLGFSYGASSGSANFASLATTALGSHNTQVSCQYLGYSPTTLVTSFDSLIAAANAFQQGEASTLGNVGTSTLYLLYTSYYGIAGYPGVPAGTAARVTQQAQIASDYLLYDSLVNRDFSAYYGDTNYSTLPFFVDLKAYDTALSAYMTAALANSQTPSAPVPTPAGDALLSNWQTTASAASAAGATPNFQTYVLANGIVPKKLADYDIPLRYAYPDSTGNGTLGGILYTPTKPIAAATSLAANAPAVDYSLYLINRAGTGGGLLLEYLWDTGNYFLTNVTGSNGQPEASLVDTALSTFALTGNVATQYVIVNTANGLVMTDSGGNNGMVASHFASGNANQLWSFYVDNGAGNCTAYAPQPADAGAPGTNCTVDGNYPGTNCGSGIYAISSEQLTAHTSGYWQISSTSVGSEIVTNGGGGCAHCNSSCNGGACDYTSCGGGPVASDLFFLEPWNSGTTHAIYSYSGGAVSWVATDPAVTGVNLPPPGYGNAPDGGALAEAVQVGGNTGQANELWAFVPAGNVDTSP